ncbi:MAG: RES family NAD+ phosphorylase [Silvibacterium sp.]
MVLWRISRHQNLNGAGGLRAGARWNHPGHPIVYLAESPAGALLEVCVHTAANDVPPDFTLLRVEGPGLEVPSIAPAELPKDWRERIETTRDLGTHWLERKESVLLRVPSALVPQTANFLLNPLHPDAKMFQIIETLVYPFDARIKE